MTDVRVKICGVSTLETLDATLDAGADMVGFVFFAKSPRNVSLPTAAQLAARARGRAQSVALVVDADDALLAQIVHEVAPDMLQLHGQETLERARDIRTRFGRSVIKAIAVETAVDANGAHGYRGAADIILFDAKVPKGAVLPGGNGVTFDWHALAAVKDEFSWMLSGGLNADNVATAIRLTGATAVDVSSGVETAPGMKDIAKIRAFIAAAKGR